ncbi:MAG: hypothetical protein K2W92_00690 [Alphaproteobacteria bacterium]|nr:hypothetical protein [Alphaproteobacteria bacterium]
MLTYPIDTNNLKKNTSKTAQVFKKIIETVMQQEYPFLTINEFLKENEESQYTY